MPPTTGYQRKEWRRRRWLKPPDSPPDWRTSTPLVEIWVHRAVFSPSPLGPEVVIPRLDKLAGEAELQKKPIESFMTVEPKVLSPDDTVGDAIRLMTEGGYRRLPLVKDGGRIFGMVTVRCIVNHFAEHFPNEVYNHPPRINQWFTSREGA